MNVLICPLSDGGPAKFRAVLRAARQVRADVLVTSVLCHGALLAAEAPGLPAVGQPAHPSACTTSDRRRRTAGVGSKGADE